MRAAAVYCALPSYRLLTPGFARWRAAAAADDDDDVAAGDDADGDDTDGDDTDGDAGVKADVKNKGAYSYKIHSIPVLVITGRERGDEERGRTCRYL